MLTSATGLVDSVVMRPSPFRNIRRRTTRPRLSMDQAKSRPGSEPWQRDCPANNLAAPRAGVVRVIENVPLPDFAFLLRERCGFPQTFTAKRAKQIAERRKEVRAFQRLTSLASVRLPDEPRAALFPAPLPGSAEQSCPARLPESDALHQATLPESAEQARPATVQEWAEEPCPETLPESVEQARPATVQEWAEEPCPETLPESVEQARPATVQGWAEEPCRATLPESAEQARPATVQEWAALYQVPLPESVSKSYPAKSPERSLAKSLAEFPGESRVGSPAQSPA